VDLELARQLSPVPEPPSRRGDADLVRYAVWAGVVLVIALSVWAGLTIRGQRAKRVAMRIEAMQAILTGPIPDWLPGEGSYRRRVWSEVLRAYGRHGTHPLWSPDGEPGPSARAFVKALAEAPRDGLEPNAYGESFLREELAARRDRRSQDPKAEAARLARLDARLTASYLRFTRELVEGRLPAGSLDPDWLALRDSVDVAAALSRALRSARAARMVAELGRRDREYRQLRDALRDQRRIEARGGWPTIPPGAELKAGMRDERVPGLRARLATSGDLADAAGDDEYDAALAAGVRRYQSRMGLDITGRLDEPTRRSLGVSATERRRTLELNLERQRWLPQRLPDPIIRVNIPESHLRVTDSDSLPIEMRAVVGTPNDPTPVFADVVSYLEFHPTWGIPKKILVNEMLPKFKKDEEFFVTSGIRVFDIHPEIPQEVDPRDVPWERVEEDTFPYIVRQDAGPQNPLGQIKFMCPNEYDVYLHDTPARRFFDRASRFLSHGCVRVQDPMVLAAYLLRDTPVASPDSMLAIMADSSWRRVGLKRKLPVLVEYRTAWVDDAGVVHFRPDVYGLDRRLDEALKSGRVSGFDLNPLVLRNPLMPTTTDWAALKDAPGAELPR
jgi:murein L,D-transpeptidase YcbB/YkuD